jgi:crossover junction endodeoxyribonuclease RuvC
MTVILGIDPGLQHTGWGIISAQNNQISFISCGTIHSNSKDDMAKRLTQLHQGIKQAISLYRPVEAAIEETFVNKNSLSSLKLGQARGAIMLSVALEGLALAEYSTNMVKKSVVGTGHADKEQVAMMVKTLLPASNAASADASDALAVAICHAHQRTITKLTGKISA